MKISPGPSLLKRGKKREIFFKEGNSSLLQREARRDLVYDVHAITD
jgi:hypothetical protein